MAGEYSLLAIAQASSEESGKRKSKLSIATHQPSVPIMLPRILLRTIHERTCSFGLEPDQNQRNLRACRRCGKVLNYPAALEHHQRKMWEYKVFNLQSP